MLVLTSRLVLLFLLLPLFFFLPSSSSSSSPPLPPAVSNAAASQDVTYIIYQTEIYLAKHNLTQDLIFKWMSLTTTSCLIYSSLSTTRTLAHSYTHILTFSSCHTCIRLYVHTFMQSYNYTIIHLYIYTLIHFYFYPLKALICPMQSRVIELTLFSLIHNFQTRQKMNSICELSNCLRDGLALKERGEYILRVWEQKDKKLAPIGNCLSPIDDGNAFHHSTGQSAKYKVRFNDCHNGCCNKWNSERGTKKLTLLQIGVGGCKLSQM